MRPIRAPCRWQCCGRSTALARHDFTIAGPAFRDRFDRDEEAAAQEATQPVVVTASVTDSFDTKLNESVKEQRDVETGRDRAVLAANSVAFEENQELVDQVEQPERPLENGEGSWRRCTSPIVRGSPHGIL